MNKDLIAIFEYLEKERGIKRDIIISAIEESLLAAAQKSVQGHFNVSVQINPKTCDIEVVSQKEVVSDVAYPEEEISLEDARALNPYVEVGQWLSIPVTPHDFGRIAAQAARQVIAQKLRSAERDVIYEEYRHRVNEIVSGSVKKMVKGATLIVDLGKVEAIMPERFYPRTEKYKPGDRVRALLFEVRDTESGGAQVVLTRSHPEFVIQLFAQEVPEMQEGTIAIERIARDPGYRTKIAVISYDHKVDPVGAFVGVRGNRVKNVIHELNGEKIDIIPYTEDPLQFLRSALAPIEMRKAVVSEDQSAITIVVSDEDYPIALGRRGMNARLNGQLVGVDLQVQKISQYQSIVNLERQELVESDNPALDEPLKPLEGISSMVIDSFIAAGLDTPRKLLGASQEQLAAISEVSSEMIETAREKIRNSLGG